MTKEEIQTKEVLIDSITPVVKSKKNKNKKKNRKKKPPVQFTPFQVEKVSVEYTKRKGRHLVANDNIPSGELAFTETPYAFTIRSKCIRQFCSHCLGECPPKTIGCLVCSSAFYCSTDCQTKDSQLHSIGCSVFSQIDTISVKTNCDSDLLRLCLRIACQSLLEVDAPLHHSFTDLLTLSHHLERFDSSWRSSISSAIQLCLPLLPLTTTTTNTNRNLLTKEELVRICCRINVNAHGLRASNARNTDIALGLFCINPFANHSCAPNCLFINNGREMRMIAVKHIPKGEELSISYIDIFETRQARQEELLRTKFFQCRCARCTEDLERSVDRFLDGILCPRRKCLQSHSVLLSTKDDQNFICESCAQITSPEKISPQIQQLVSLQEAATQARETGNRSREKELLEKFTQSSKGVYHPLHICLMDAEVRLMNCYDRLEELAKSAGVVGQIIGSLDQVFPGLSVETSNFLYHQGSTYEQMVKDILKKEQSGPKTNTLLTRAKSVLSRCLSIRTTIFGVSHPFTEVVASSLYRL